MMVNADFARFCADLEKFLDDQYEKYKDTDMQHMYPHVDVQVYVEGDLAAKFYEEGIDFYPKDEEKP